VPREDRIRRDERRNVSEKASPEHFASCGESSSLLVSKADAFVADVFSEDAVLSLEVFNGSKLVPIDIAGERDNEEVPRASG
jgi:hypothetical protein